MAFDVDGVLAPLVDHADDSELLPGTLEALSTRSPSQTTVAIVSGRALESLERLFAFPSALHVIGSHGLEDPRRRCRRPSTTTSSTRSTSSRSSGERGVDAAGDGAWLEYKPASVVLHTREADPAARRHQRSTRSRTWRGVIDGAQVKPGSDVVELLARTREQGRCAARARADDSTGAPIVYFGDDVTDEDAFRMMSDADMSVRVGPDESAADTVSPGRPQRSPAAARRAHRLPTVTDRRAPRRPGRSRRGRGRRSAVMPSDLASPFDLVDDLFDRPGQHERRVRDHVDGRGRNARPGRRPSARRRRHA